MQDLLDFAKGGGLIPVVVQDVTSNKILMLAYMNREAFEETVRTQRACYYSRKRQRLWRKGEESGNVQLVRNILIDCDNDTVLIKVEQIGEAACHTGYHSCFYQELVDGELKVIEERIFDPNDVYQKKGTRIMKKILRFVGPNGSLKNRWKMYLKIVGYDLPDEPDSRGCYGISNGIEFWERDRRMIPFHVANTFDAGLTGKDLVIGSGVEDLSVVTDLCFSRKTDQPTRWVLARKGECKLVGRKVKIGCEIPGLVPKLLKDAAIFIADYEVVQLEGNEEQAIEEGLCDILLCVTETGRSIARAELKVFTGCEQLLVSTPQIISKPCLSADKDRALHALSCCLQAAVGAGNRVMVKFDLPEGLLDSMSLPSTIAPTVNKTLRSDWVAVEICIQRSEIPAILPRIEEAGGLAIVMQNVEAYLYGRNS